jgi:nuclear GTP-binding protein
MGKFSNKPKSRPTKKIDSSRRKKIDKRVKEHKRKIRKEARKMTALGLYKKSIISLFLN